MLAQLAATAAVGLAAGLSIGCIGVGGVIIVPILVQAAGVPIHAAIAAAMAGFIVTGAVGTTVFVRRGTLGVQAAVPMLIGAMPAAILGAFAAQAASATALEVAIGLLTALSGLSILRRGAPEHARTALLRPTAGAAVGAAAGFLSALTGTGGPALLLPMLLWLDVPMLAALGLSQAIQLPVALLATAGNFGAGALDLALALPLALGLALGAWIGARLAHALDQQLLRRLLAWALLGVGLLMLGRVAAHLA